MFTLKFYDQQLPSKDDFYSMLTEEGITYDSYSHAQNVWNTFKMKTMDEYHDLNLKSDILLLGDVFEKFRETCLQYYKLDPRHYFTSPGLSWDAMLKMTQVQLELMTDIEMFQFIEKGMHGAISYIANRHGDANNKYMTGHDSSKPSKYIMYQFIEKGMHGAISYIANRHGDANNKYMTGHDSSKPSKYIMYLDANNLYGFAMSQCLPTGGFRWLSQRKIEKINLATCAADGKKGMIIEVDLEYLSSLRKLHNDYPLAAEKMKVNKEMLSPYCEMIRVQVWNQYLASFKACPDSGQKREVCIALQKLATIFVFGIETKESKPLIAVGSVTMVETVY